MRAAIALGSNLGDRLANLQRARDRIRALDGMTELTMQSAVYETSPVDCEPGAQNFYNAVIEIGFEKSAEDRKSTRLNSSHSQISYAVFCLKKKKKSID